jgi:long-subunit fatty acid transport protein
MKKTLFTLMSIALLGSMAWAGGIVTNANQSAAYIRMPAQDATLAIDAVYYNPAGLAFMADGLHIGLNNQYIKQTRTISSTFPGMNSTEFKGGVTAPFFPGIYLAYKKEKVAFSFGFNPVGGGGSAEFDGGLPSFEQQVAVLPGALTTNGINTTRYSFDSEFEGRSLMYGIQANGSYAINDMIAFSLGVRYVIAKNFYTGFMKNIQINPQHPLNPSGAGSMTSAPAFFTTLATAATTAANNMQPLITNGAGGLTLSQAVGASIIDAATAAQLAGGLGVSDYTTLPYTISQIQATYQGNAAAMTNYARLTADKEVDTEQSGSGIGPVIGLDLKLSDKLNIGFRYEHKVEIKVKNKTTKDDVRLYPDGVKTPNDMPTTLSLGAQYKATDKLLISGGVHYYFDKKAAYGKVKSRDANGIPTFYENDEVIDNNFLEIALGFEYALNEKMLVSAGYLRTQSGVNEKYQSDLSHSLSTNTMGAGVKYFLKDNIGLNLGVMYSSYLKETKPFTTPVNYDETYKRTALVFGLGVDFRF